MTQGTRLLIRVAEHARLARERELRFYLARRDGPDGQWQRAGDDMEDLVAAFSAAMRMSRNSEHDVGVVCDREDIEIVYWNSKRPDLLNDAALAPS